MKASEKGEERRGIKGRQNRKDLERGKKRTVGDARKSNWRMERKKILIFLFNSEEESILSLNRRGEEHSGIE